MTKSYEDGIIDAIEIVSHWRYLGIHPSMIESILTQLNKLLTTANFEYSQHNISIFDITMEDKKSLENDQINLIQSFEE